jgi:lysyl-tRNA synthetase, class II
MTGERVGVTGRVIFVRNTGKLCFATLREGDAELQAMLSLDRVGEKSLTAWKADVDLGDHVFVEGEVGTSRRGELSMFADSWQLTAKALRPLPVAHNRGG